MLPTRIQALLASLLKSGQAHRLPRCDGRRIDAVHFGIDVLHCLDRSTAVLQQTGLRHSHRPLAGYRCGRGPVLGHWRDGAPSCLAISVTGFQASCGYSGRTLRPVVESCRPRIIEKDDVACEAYARGLEIRAQVPPYPACRHALGDDQSLAHLPCEYRAVPNKGLAEARLSGSAQWPSAGGAAVPVYLHGRRVADLARARLDNPPKSHTPIGAPVPCAPTRHPEFTT